MQNRRQFLQETILGAGACAFIPGTLSAQARRAFQFEPDGKILIAGMEVPVDIALLGDNGEPTAGFYASLDPFHGQPFSRGWGTVYDYLLRNGPLSTDEQDIERVITHVTIHGIQRSDLDEVYQKAKKIWDENPHLRVNSNQAFDADDHFDHDHDQHVIDPHLHHDHD